MTLGGRAKKKGRPLLHKVTFVTFLILSPNFGHFNTECFLSRFIFCFVI